MEKIENPCIKCSYISYDNKEKFEQFLCSICYYFSPDNKIDFENYINEKVNFKELETFRKYKKENKNLKQGMAKKASEGKVMSRVPFGYKMENGSLVKNNNYRSVEIIFEEFLNNNYSLNHLAQKYGFSVNGLKKILTNFTYIGKVKFNNQIHDGKHEPIISSTLFNHVQNKLERLGIKKGF